MGRDARSNGRRESAGDEGFTLVELVVSLTILAVGIVAVIGTTNSSFRSAGSASGRSKGVAVATMETEKLRAIPYAELEVTSSAELRTETVNGVDYSIEKTVQWVGEPGVPNAYKEGWVSVSWDDASGNHEVHQSTYLYPGGIGPASATTSTTEAVTACTPVAPNVVLASPPSDVLQASTVVDLTWTAPQIVCDVETFIIQYSTNNFATQNEVSRTATANTYRVTGLSANTSYKFRVAARSAAGRQSSWSPIASLTTSVSTQSTCRLGNLTVTPTAINKRSASSGSGLESDLAVDLPKTGTCNGFRAVYRPTPSTTQTATLTLSSTGSYQGTLTGRTIAWDVGKRYVDIYDVTTNENVASVLVTVCEHNVSRCA